MAAYYFFKLSDRVGPYFNIARATTRRLFITKINTSIYNAPAPHGGGSPSQRAQGDADICIL